VLFGVRKELQVLTAQLLLLHKLFICFHACWYYTQECFTLAFPSGTMHFDAMSSLGGSSYIDTSLMPLAGPSSLTSHVHAVYSMHTADDDGDLNDDTGNNSESGGSDDEHRPAKVFKRASV
jgi:hypothetical protein